MDDKELADRIVTALFTAGDRSGTVADRIVLIGVDGRDLGGWGMRPAVRHVLNVIQEAKQPSNEG